VTSLVATSSASASADYAKGMLVQHEKYGKGRVIEVGGTGPLRKVKVRFGSEDRTFLVEKARLEIVSKG
jgi:hypothetical protein